MIEIKVVRLQKFEKDSVIKAFVDVNVNDAFLIKGFRIIAGPKGLYVAMPQERGKNDRWYNTVNCLSDEIRAHVKNCILSAFFKEQDYINN